MAAAPKPMRNWAAIDPLMRKGGAHQTPKKQTRPKMDWRDALDDFEDWRDSANTEDDNEGAKVPSFFGRDRHREETRWELQLAERIGPSVTPSSFNKPNLPR